LELKHKGLDAKTFGELLESVREGGAILRGERKPSRRFVVEASGVRAIRECTSLSQSEFADAELGTGPPPPDGPCRNAAADHRA